MGTTTDGKQFPELTKLLKPEQVAEILNISRSFTYHLLSTDAIPVIRLGKACRVRPQDLADYIERNLHHLVDDS